MGPKVDRSIARAIAWKRLVTGSTALAFGCGVIVAVAIHGTGMTAQAVVAVLLFWGGGAWALRDGLRLRRELLR